MKQKRRATMTDWMQVLLALFALGLSHLSFVLWVINPAPLTVGEWANIFVLALFWFLVISQKLKT